MQKTRKISLLTDAGEVSLSLEATQVYTKILMLKFYYLCYNVYNIIRLAFGHKWTSEYPVVLDGKRNLLISYASNICNSM